MLGDTKHVPVHLLPARVIHKVAVHSINLHFCITVFCVIILERADEDKRHETTQKDHHHKRVENGEPVDLVLEKRIIKIPVETVGKCFIHWNPLYGIRKFYRTRAITFDGLQFLRGCKVHLNNALFFVVVPNSKRLVCVQVSITNFMLMHGVLLHLLELLGRSYRLPYHTPYRQVIQIHLVPIVLRDCILERFGFSGTEFLRTKHSSRYINFEVGGHARMLQKGVSFQDLSNASRFLLGVELT
mmetsp:Transcript_22583/g.40039  ORF Transcript_22583/g.40039 Transcript_22583/m.40039 type:complete len:243 (+) Transcript_22583:957-1685(+)